MTLLIKNADIIGKEGIWDIVVQDGKISEITQNYEDTSSETIDAEENYVSPGLVNTHTHAAMTLFRGYADDLPLQTWLEDKIWPLEAQLNEDYVYWGTKLACLEMIKSGTVAFNDMYYHMETAAKATEEMGMKAMMSYGFVDLNDDEKRESEIENSKELVEHLKDSELIEPALGPHAVYTVSREGLEWCADFSKKEDIPVHFHLGETEDELNDFKEEHEVSLTSYLNDIGLLNEKLIAAHCVWLEDEDYENLGNSNAVVSHNPTSNMKLGAGKPMDYKKMKDNDIDITLGTDGCASNNNLDMLEEAKIAALQQKMPGDPTVLPAEEAFQMITEEGARALKTGGGVIEENRAADLIIIEKDELATPGYNPISDMIYSMNGANVRDVIINGDIVMKDGHVDGEEKIIKKTKQAGRELVKEVG